MVIGAPKPGFGEVGLTNFDLLLGDELAAEDELDVSSLRAYGLINGSGTMAYDSIGVGAGVGALLKNAGKKNYSKFNAAGEVFNPDKEYSPKITNKKKFENLKAQAWRDVADRLMNTYNAVTKGHKFNASEMISISSDLADLEDLKIEFTYLIQCVLNHTDQ